MKNRKKLVTYFDIATNLFSAFIYAIVALLTDSFLYICLIYGINFVVLCLFHTFFQEKIHRKIMYPKGISIDSILHNRSAIILRTQIVPETKELYEGDPKGDIFLSYSSYLQWEKTTQKFSSMFGNCFAQQLAHKELDFEPQKAEINLVAKTLLKISKRYNYQKIARHIVHYSKGLSLQDFTSLTNKLKQIIEETQ